MENKPKKEKRKYRWLRRILRVILGLLLIIFLSLLFLKSQWGQSFIVDKISDYIAKKTDAKIDIDRLFITFDGNLQLENFFLKDQKGDTLVFSKSLEADLELWKIIKNGEIGVEMLHWKGLQANITRKDKVKGYNFQFLIDAFTTKDTIVVAQDTISKSPPKVNIGKLRFSDINIVFKDDVIGIDSEIYVGEFATRFKTTDIEKMVFKASDMVLSDSRVKLIKNKKGQNDEKEESPKTTILPKFSAESIVLTNTELYYQSQPDKISTALNFSDFQIIQPNLNLQDKEITINDILLKDSQFNVETSATTKDSSTTSKAENPQPFTWPEITLNIAKIDFSNNQFSYRVANTISKAPSFDVNNIKLSDLSLNLTDLLFKEKKASLALNKFRFNEASGLNLKQFGVSLDMDDNHLHLNNLKLQMNNNVIEGKAGVKYPSVSAFLQVPEKAMYKLSVPVIRLDIEEVLALQPKLKNNDYLKTLSEKPLSGQLEVSGDLLRMHVENTQLNWGENTRITASATIENMIRPKELEFTIPSLQISSTRSDFLQFADEKKLNIRFPDSISLKANAKGTLNNVVTEATLTTTQGIVNATAKLSNQNTFRYDASLTTHNVELGTLFNNPQIGALDLSLKSSGSGKNINNLNVFLDTNISKLTLNNYSIKDLAINGKIKRGKGKITSTYKDKNLNFTLDSFVVLDSIAPKIKAELNLIGANLQRLGLMQRDVKTAMKIHANFKGNVNAFDATTKITDGTIVYDNNTYILDDFNARAHTTKDTTSVLVRNKMLNLDLKSNSNPQAFTKALKRHILSYFYRDVEVLDSVKNPVKLQLEGKLSQSPVLKDVFFVNAKDLDTISVFINFDEKARRFKTNITAPHIQYGNNSLDSLVFAMDTNPKDFKFNLGIKGVTSGVFEIPTTKITGEQNNHELALKFLAYTEEAKLTEINAQITGNRKRLALNINPDNLTINKNKWTIPKNNEIVLSNEQLSFHNFKISKGKQSIELTNQLPNITKPHSAITFEKFQLSELLDYFNPKIQLATGALNGSFVLENTSSGTGIVADVGITNFKLLNTNLGEFNLSGNPRSENHYTFNAGLKKGDVDLDLTGDYFIKKKASELDIDVNINTFKMKALNSLSLGKIKEGNGQFSGKFKISGTTSAPKYEGTLAFSDAGFTLTAFNTPFTMEDETLSIDNSGIAMTNFTLKDANSNTLVLSGKIGTESFMNPTFDLTLKATDFQVLNASKKDNNTLYGTAFFDANATLSGDLQIPKLRADITVDERTNLTYVLPSTVANIEERDGVVVFVNRENPDAILTQTTEETATVKGFDIATALKLNRGAAATVIINKDTGDNFKVAGEGDLNLKMSPNGAINLSGVYEASQGHYELNLYNIVKRKFLMSPGSRVTWLGDPFGAKLDVSAIYNVEASASGLMASRVSSAGSSVQNTYKTVLPFNVFLNIDGELLRPKISFGLDMPEEEHGALGGQIYARVQELNQQKAELNQQVFSLLLFNRFYSNSVSDGSAGGFETLARNNVNDAISQQLNRFSEKLLGKSGIELDFGIDSYTDYQGNTATERTQLDIAVEKKLLDDRLIVRVGSEVDIQGSDPSGEATPLIGNVSLEYMLSEDGTYRLKGFRKNEFENVIDGQTIVSGIGLLFTKEFNQFKELWNSLFKSKKEKNANTKQ
ncbi:translocation/assembly module TamB [Tenacibaculum tangerinum]|uniref:Translocation/assembly module TamB n=1 Tax=Tenacibaculum tangerinum TaxID=3038772 RepID=A0ABY8L049_9FLAO|nr:translocation/assembly module TamB domain-containing protein [Tenacibaculum tangerinum]WGH74710.1 translocation/assembly module TamB [Tenacibaculum tangerinum]